MHSHILLLPPLLIYFIHCVLILSLLLSICYHLVMIACNIPFISLFYSVNSFSLYILVSFWTKIDSV
jgi:hypothetical protein